MAEHAILYVSDYGSDKEEYIEIIIENFPIVPLGTAVKIKDGETFLLQSEVSFYCITEQGLEVDIGEVSSSIFQELLAKCHKTDRATRFRYPTSITLAC